MDGNYLEFCIVTQEVKLNVLLFFNLFFMFWYISTTTLSLSVQISGFHKSWSIYT